MKRLILICIGVLFLCSCRSTFYVTPEDDYIDFVKATNDEIISRGYIPIACNCDTTLSSQYGWGGYSLPMDRIYISDYVFVDSTGDTVEYSFAVDYNCTTMGDFYIDSAAVIYCKATKERDCDICTGTNMSRLTSPPKRKVRWQTEESVLGWIVGVPAAVFVGFLAWSAMQNQR